mgnify:FL=1
MENLNYKEILVKKPWFELLPDGYLKHGSFKNLVVSDKSEISMPKDKMSMLVKTQADFLREYYPSAHRIFNEKEYPDIWKMTPGFDPEKAENG